MDFFQYDKYITNKHTHSNKPKNSNLSIFLANDDNIHTQESTINNIITEITSIAPITFFVFSTLIFFIYEEKWADNIEKALKTKNGNFISTKILYYYENVGTSNLKCYTPIINNFTDIIKKFFNINNK